MSVRATRSGDRVVISLTGLDRVFALKYGMEIPAPRIASVDVLPRTAVPPTPGTWLRHPGTHIPGLARHGSDGTEPNRDFWAVYRRREVLVMHVEARSYSRLVLGTAQPHQDAALLGS